MTTTAACCAEAGRGQWHYRQICTGPANSQLTYQRRWCVYNCSCLLICNPWQTYRTLPPGSCA